jgi:multiple sugar transport system permease protein
MGAIAEAFRDYFDTVYDQVAPIAMVQQIIATGLLMGVMPVVVLYILTQRAFVESIGQSGLKM